MLSRNNCSYKISDNTTSPLKCGFDLPELFLAQCRNSKAARDLKRSKAQSVFSNLNGVIIYVSE